MARLFAWNLIACALLTFGCKSSEGRGGDSAKEPPVAAEPAPEKREPTLLEKILAESTLAGALSVVRPHLADSSGELDTGALTLALWSAKRLTWHDLQALPATKHALVLKDPESERGKRNCYGGTVIEIQVDRSAGEPVYMGGLFSEGGSIIRFAAVGSTGEIVAQSYARFCGITTGLYNYSNSAGGTSHAVFLVGMFDLPENKRAGLSPSASAQR